MRIVTAVLSIILAVVLYDFYNTVSLAHQISGIGELSGIAGAALIGALLWLVGGATVYFYPRTAIVAFVLSFLVMFPIQAGANITTDLWVYMWGGPIFAVTSFLGWREKQRADDEHRGSPIQQIVQRPQVDYIHTLQRKSPHVNAALEQRIAQYKTDTGFEVQANTSRKTPKHCDQCGTILDEGSKFCPECGKRLSRE